MNLERSNTESRPPGMPKPLASSSVATANPFMDDQRHCINNAPSELCHHDHEHLVARRQESAQNDMASKPLCLQEHIRELENLALVIRELQVPTHGIISQTMERLVELAGSRDFLPAFSSLQRCIMRAKWARDDVFGAGYIIPWIQVYRYLGSGTRLGDVANKYVDTRAFETMDSKSLSAASLSSSSSSSWASASPASSPTAPSSLFAAPLARPRTPTAATSAAAMETSANGIGCASAVMPPAIPDGLGNMLAGRSDAAAGDMQATAALAAPTETHPADLAPNSSHLLMPPVHEPSSFASGFLASSPTPPSIQENPDQPSNNTGSIQTPATTNTSNTTSNNHCSTAQPPASESHVTPMDLFPNGIYSEPTPAQVINPYGNGYFPAEIDMHEILSIGLARPKLPYAGADLHEPSFASPQALPSAMAHAHANSANVASVPAAIASPAVHAHASCSSAQPILHSQSAQHPSTPLWSPESFKPASSLAQPDQSQLLALGNLATPPHQMPLAMDDTPSLMITSPATSFSVSNYPQGQMGANAATKHTTSGLLDGAFQTLQSAYQLFQHHEQLYAQQQQQQQQQQTAGMIPHASPFPIHQTASAIPDHQLTVPTTQYNATSFSANAPCSMTGSIGTGSTVRSTTIPGGQPSSLLNMASAAAVLPPPAPVKVRKPRAPRNPAKPPRSRSKAGAAQMTAMLPSDAIAQSFAGTALAKFESGAAALSAAAPSGIPPAADPSTQAVAADLFGTAAPSASSAADADTALSVSIASLYAPAPEPVSAPVVQAKRPGRPPSKTPGRKKAQQVAGAGGPTTPAKRGPRPKATNPDGTPVARKPRAEPYARATGKAAAARAAKKAAAIHASSAKLSGGDFFLDSVLSAPFVADSDLVVQPGAPSDLLLPDASVQGDCQAFAVQELVGSTQPAKDMLAALESLASVDAAGMLGLGGSGSKSVAASEAQAVNTVDADAGVAPMSS